MKVLVVDDDETLRLTVRMTLESLNFQVEEASNGSEAIEKVFKKKYDTVILDVNMPGINGIDALTRIKEISPQSVCLILTAHSDVKDAVRAIKLGAYDYLEKPFEIEPLLKLIENAKAASDLVEAAAYSAPQVHFSDGRSMIGTSNEIQRVFDIVHKLAKVDTSVLIRGESGTGKELVARALHYNSHRRKGPLVAVNCAALPENLIESEFFGHEKGAFTGADKRKIGKFQYAEGGTLFLDEIGDISLAMQVKLLRVLQEKIFSPVGGNQEISTDVRVIAATNRPLEEMIQTAQFRSDLFYRLNVLPINLPPLRERRDDILPLTDFMIKKFNKIHHKSIKKIDPHAIHFLQAYSWPGNIRELENVIEHAFILESDEVIQPSSLPIHITKSQQQGDARNVFDEVEALNYPALKEKFEREFLVKALQAFGGRINQTAVHTKMTKVTLLRKLEKYGINPRHYHKMNETS